MPIVLVVDDSEVDRRLVGGLLARNSQLQVEYAVDGKEALDRIEALAPQLIVTDLVMPEMNGLELVGEVKHRFPDLPVVLMTGKGSEDIAYQALQAGAASYVPKNVLPRLLLETVESVLTAAQAKRVQQQLMTRVSEATIRFQFENDSTLIPAAISYAQDMAVHVGLCAAADTVRVAIALEEALRNAMFHGNLEISSACRDGDPETYRRTLQERLENEPYSRRQLYLELHLTPAVGEFIIRDEGPGFDPRTLPDPTDPENLERCSGRGLLLMRTFMDEVLFNATGNQVTLVKLAKVG
mgnify:CR=1 FL=1